MISYYIILEPHTICGYKASIKATYYIILPRLNNLQNMIPYRFEEFLEDLVFLVETGEIPMSRIDDAVERILRVKFISGVFEHPFSDPSLLDIVGCKVRCPTSIFLFLFIYSPYFFLLLTLIIFHSSERIIYHHASHPWSKNKILIWMVRFLYRSLVRYVTSSDCIILYLISMLNGKRLQNALFAHVIQSLLVLLEHTLDVCRE